MSKQTKTWLTDCELRILDYLANIYMLKHMGCSVDKDGYINKHCHSDVPNQIQGYEILMNSEIETMMALRLGEYMYGNVQKTISS